MGGYVLEVAATALKTGGSCPPAAAVPPWLILWLITQ
jgi:hypothetical protein